MYQEIEFSPAREDKNRIVILTGVSGSGKDYLIKRAQQKLSFGGVEVVNFGEMMLKEIQSQGGSLEHRDRIRTDLTQVGVRKIVDVIVDSLIKRQPLVINTHSAYKQNGSIIINPEVDKRLGAHTYLFIWSEPNSIQEWRRGQARQRDMEALEAIDIHQRIALGAVRSMALVYGSGVRTIYNKADDLDHSITRISEIVERIR